MCGKTGRDMAEDSQPYPDRFWLDRIVFDGKPSELLYFAYGANMNTEQIRARCANPQKVTTARLLHHELAFFGYSRTWDGGQDTVLPAFGREVWGVVYKLSALDSDRLDVWQDARMDGTGAYFHYPARVIDVEGCLHTVVFYKKDMLSEPKKPSCEYLDFIVRGAAEHGFPLEYIAGLRRIESRPADFPVPKRRHFGRELLLDVHGSPCDHCTDS
jgi:gamma-glutamylcyclotransferase